MTKTMNSVREIEHDLNEITDAIGRSSLDSALEECSRVILRSVDQNFAESASPQMRAWPPRLSGGSWPLLIKTGALKSAATGAGAGAVKRVTHRQLEVGVNKDVDLGGIPGAAVHNFGYPPRNIAQREFMAPRSDALDRCEAIIADAVDSLIG